MKDLDKMMSGVNKIKQEAEKFGEIYGSEIEKFCEINKTIENIDNPGILEEDIKKLYELASAIDFVTSRIAPIRSATVETRISLERRRREKQKERRKQ